MKPAGAPAGPARALVVCIGNDLVADDGAGCAVYDVLTARGPRPGVRLLMLATGGITLLDEFEGEDLLIVVDAVQLGAPPGTVHVRRWDDLPPLPGGAVSAHGIGIREAIEIASRLSPERTPRDAVLVGIEGRQFDGLGEPPTPEVAQAVPRAAAAVDDLLRDYSL